MGNLCDCQQTSESATPKTPLLSGSNGVHGNNSHHVGPGLSKDPTPITVPPGQSARKFRPDSQDFETSLQLVTAVNLVRIPTMPPMDKTFQDHAKLYNELHSSFVSLRQCLHDFKSHFVAETSGIPVMSECLGILGKRCGGATLTGSRTKNRIEIIYDPRQVSLVCQGPAEDVLKSLELYNQANATIKKILEKAGQVQSSIQLVLDEEAKLKREVTKADPDGKLGPEPLRMTSENINKLRKLPEKIDTIQKYTKKIFDEICQGSKPLFSS